MCRTSTGSSSRDWGAAIGRNRHGTQVAPLLAAHRAWVELDAYTQGLVRRHRRDPGAGGELVAALLAAGDGETLAENEVAAMFVMLLLAGHETTTNLLSIGLKDLLQAPGQWRRLVEDPGIVPGAVEELLRYVTPSQLLGRRAVADVEIGGITVQAERTVIGLRGSANRDPDVFADPDRLDVGRPGAGRHLALGFGSHYCLGAALTRLETAVVLRQLATRHPRATLATDTLRWGGPASLRRLIELPVALSG